MVRASGDARDAAPRRRGPRRRSTAARSACGRDPNARASFRDALLPKLISGEIRVPDTADPAEVIEPLAEAVAAAAS